jgi:hypothetical protein
VRVSPPGFGAPLPDDFPATCLAYRDWLEDELAGFKEPVDLVGVLAHPGGLTATLLP